MYKFGLLFFFHQQIFLLSTVSPSGITLCSHLASSCSFFFPCYFSSPVLSLPELSLFFASFCSSPHFSLLPLLLLSPLSCARFVQISQCKSSCSCTLLYWLHRGGNKKRIDLNVIYPAPARSLSPQHRLLACDLTRLRGISGCK